MAPKLFGVVVHKYSVALFSLFIISLSINPAKGRNTLQAVAFDKVTVESCLGSGPVAPGQRIVECTIAIDAGKIKGYDLAAAHLNRGQAYGAVGDQSRAESGYREAVRLFGGTIDSGKLSSEQFTQRGMAHHSLGDVERALSDYDDAIRLDAGNARAHIDRGILLASRKAQLRSAILDFNRALDLVPDNVDTLILRGDAYASVGEEGRALADLDRALELMPGNPRALLVRGLINARRGETQRAFADYNMALAIDDHYVDALVNRAAIYASMGYATKAIEDLDIAIALAPKNALAVYNRGYAHFARREYDQAIADYSRAIELDGRMAWAYTNRCLTRAALGRDLPGALADCDEALRLQPDNLKTREARGFVYLKLGETEIALKEYDSALRADPNRPLALYGRGLARIAKGEAKSGEADREAARSLMPNVDTEFSAYGLR